MLVHSFGFASARSNVEGAYGHSGCYTCGTNPGVGCIDSVCRFCKVQDTAQSGHYLTCKSLGYDLSDSTTPVSSAGASTTPAPATTAPASSSISTAVTSETCAARVSPGDQNVGISGVADVSCLSGGVGCNDKDTCRLCKTKDTPQSSHFLPCSTSTTTAPSSAATAAVADTLAPVVASSDLALATTAPLITTVTDESCAATVSEGDYNVGITSFADITCSDGGVGCNDINICRLCQYADSPESAHLKPCPVEPANTVRVQMAANTESGFSHEFSKLVKNDNFKWAIGAAACVGAAAVVAVVAMAVKRVTRAITSTSMEAVSGENDDHVEAGVTTANSSDANAQQ
uniref:Uncharacterized protein n=1 Tax=Globisporangium ultimum (strain ATCC 200006 / CBS 805.95 / DAOM BR144) TaxID=431595 RepID=K3W7B7_GLOUD